MAEETPQERLDCILSGRPYPDCWGDCGQIDIETGSARRGYCCDGAWDWERRMRVAEAEVERLRGQRDRMGEQRDKLREALKQARDERPEE